jgi:histidinol-phosphate aminotransferase
VVAVRESLANKEYLFANVQKIVAERERLLRELSTVSYLEPFPSHTNFILSRVIGRDALEVKLALQERGVLIRHYGHPRIRDCIRISVGRPDQNDRVLAALREV